MPVVFGKRVQGNSLIVEVSGSVGEHDCSSVVGVVRTSLTPGITQVVMDVDKLDILSSAALSELAAERHRLADAGCQLVLARANDRVKRLISLCLLDKTIPVANTVEEALGRGRRPSSRRSEHIMGPEGMEG